MSSYTGASIIYKIFGIWALYKYVCIQVCIINVIIFMKHIILNTSRYITSSNWQGKKCSRKHLLAHVFSNQALTEFNKVFR